VRISSTRGKTRRQEDQEDKGHHATLVNIAPTIASLRKLIRIDNRVDKEEEVDETGQPSATYHRTATGEEIHQGLLSRAMARH
jgi:hypothetical protein